MKPNITAKPEESGKSVSSPDRSQQKMTKSPTVSLLIGLLITLLAVTCFSWYALRQIHGLRILQTDAIDRNRKDSLLLLRMQDDLNQIAISLRDMSDPSAPYGLAAYKNEFARIQADLEDAMEADSRQAPETRLPAQQEQLMTMSHQLWTTAARVFDLAGKGRIAEARKIMRNRLSSEQAAVSAVVARLLQGNYEEEERAAAKVASIYDGVERQTYTFLAGTLVVVLVTTSYLIYSNNRIFNRIQSLSQQRQILSTKLITVQEEVLRSVSRELHDEFGQILTAVGAMLTRAERKGLPPDSPFRTEVSEVRDITQATLEKMRSLSQMLHPTVLDDYGLAKALEWYADVFQRQTGIKINFQTEGCVERITGKPAIHCYRIVQEALNNAAKHAKTSSADLALRFEPDNLTLLVRDHGTGIVQDKKAMAPGMGLIAMRERAEMMRGRIHIGDAPHGGTDVLLTIPLPQDETSVEVLESEEAAQSRHA